MLLLCITLYTFLMPANTSGQNLPSKKITAYYQKVDSVMQQKENYKNTLEAEVKKLKGQKKTARSLDEELLFNKLLYTTYGTYISDSAMVYLDKNETLAREYKRIDWLQMALIEKAYLYSATGLLTNADSCLKEVRKYPMETSIKLEYYTKLIYYLAHLDDYYQTNHQFEIEQACDSLLANAPNPSDPYHLWAEYTKWRGGDGAEYLIERLKPLVDSYEESNPWYANLAFALAALYIITNQEEQALDYFTKLTIAEVKKVNRDIPSVIILMSHAFNAEELDYAYGFLKYILENQAEFPDRIRAQRMSGYILSVVEEMQKLNTKQKQADKRFISILVTLCAIVILCCIFIILLLRKQIRSKKLLQKNNAELDNTVFQMKQLQQQLEEANSRMSQSNVGLTAANYIKDEYIGLLFTYCSNYITRMEELYKNVYRKLQARQYDELIKQTNQASTLINKEIQELYKQFDTVFLKIYPDFLQDFNELLRPEERIVLKKGELLNSDLRIYALVRLGIDNSTEIAKFLHLSAQTVYNARLKMRSRTHVPGEKFAEYVKFLGKSDI